MRIQRRFFSEVHCFRRFEIPRLKLRIWMHSCTQSLSLKPWLGSTQCNTMQMDLVNFEIRVMNFSLLFLSWMFESWKFEKKSVKNCLTFQILKFGIYPDASRMSSKLDAFWMLQHIAQLMNSDCNLNFRMPSNFLTHSFLITFITELFGPNVDHPECFWFENFEFLFQQARTSSRNFRKNVSKNWMARTF